MTETAVHELLEQEEDTQTDKYLTFNLDNGSYGIEIRYVTEIIGVQPITAVPGLPEYIRGIINLRGRILPVIDVRLRFKKPFREFDDRTCVIIVNIRDISVGLIVDRVSEVLSIPAGAIVPPPDFSKEGGSFIKCIGKVRSEVKLLLDLDRLLNNEEVSLQN